MAPHSLSQSSPPTSESSSYNHHIQYSLHFAMIGPAFPVQRKPSSSPRNVDSIILPDLVSHCTFKLRRNPFGKKVGAGSESWLLRTGNISVKKQKAFHGLKGGLLTAMTYPDCGPKELRVCCDYLVYLFHLDNISDCMGGENSSYEGKGTAGTADIVMNCLYHPRTYRTNARVGKMTKDYWRRLAPDATEGVKQRFISTFDLFFQAITVQAADRAAGIIPDLESYISLRRDTSGCKPCWALIEYANHLDIPDEVIEHPVLEELGEAANDLVTWSNDIFSYNVEQVKGDTHNMIVIAMQTQGLDLQQAVDFVGHMCKCSIDRFTAAKKRLPTFSDLDESYNRPKGSIDKDVAQYVLGLEDWMVGSLHWSFESERYFGKSGREVKNTRIVKLLPKKIHA